MIFSATISRTASFLYCQVDPLDLLLQVPVELLQDRTPCVHESIHVSSCLVCGLQQAAFHSYKHLQPATAVCLPLSSLCSKTWLALVMLRPPSLIQIAQLTPCYLIYLVKVSAASICQHICSHISKVGIGPCGLLRLLPEECWGAPG